MSFGDVPDPPDYTEVAAASEYAADLSFQIAEDQLAWAMEQYEAGLEVTEPVIDEMLQTMEFTNEVAEADRARYEQEYQALEDELIAEAESYATPERIELEMGRAQAGVAEQTNAAREAAEMSLESYGVNPADVRYASLDIDTRTDAAAAGAAAGQTAALSAEAKGDALRSEAINIGKGYPGYIQSAYNTSLQAGTTAASTQNAATTTASNTLTQPSSYMSTGTSALDVWGNTINAGYQNEMDAYNAQMSAMSGVGTMLGTAAGLVLMAKEGGEVPRFNYAPGGPVPQGQSPSRGARFDDVPANLTAGEFVVPEDVVRWKGSEYFYKELNKARESRQEMTGGGAVPAGPAPGGGQRMAMPRPGGGPGGGQGGQPMRRPTQPIPARVPAPAPGPGAIPPVPRPPPRPTTGALPVGAPRGYADGGTVAAQARGFAGAHPRAARQLYANWNQAPAPVPTSAPTPAPAPTAPVTLVPTLPPDYIGGREGAAPNMQYTIPAQSMRGGGYVSPRRPLNMQAGGAPAEYYPAGVDPASGAYYDPESEQWIIPPAPTADPSTPGMVLPAPTAVYAPEPAAPVVGDRPYRREPVASAQPTSGGFFGGLGEGLSTGASTAQRAAYNDSLRAQQAGPGQLSSIAPQDPTLAPPVAVQAPAGTAVTPARPAATQPVAVAPRYEPQPVTGTYRPAPVTSTYTPERRTSWDAPRATSVIEQQRAEQRTAPRVPPPFSATNYDNPIEAQRAEQRGMPYSAATTGTYGPPVTARTPRARPAAGGTTRAGEPARTPRPRPAEPAGRIVRPEEMRSRGDVTGREKSRRLKPGQITAEPESGALSAASFARQGQDYMRSKKGKGKKAKEGAVPAATTSGRSRLGRARDVAFGKEAPKRKPRKRLDIGGRIRGGIAEMFREDEEA